MIILKKFASFIFFLGLLLGWKFYVKSSNGDAYKEQLINICENDLKCAANVNRNFDFCYNYHYSIGTKRRAGRLDFEKFTNCMNQRSGHNYFAVQEGY